MNAEFGSPRTAIVTGAARRIGCVIARALAARGWTLLLHCNRSTEAADALAAEIGHARVVRADLAEPDAARRIMAAAADLPPPGLLVNNASRFEHDSLDDFDVAGWNAHIAVNLRAPAQLIQAFARVVPAGAGGLVVNLLDAKLAQPDADFFSYTISKMGLAGVTELAARALAGHGIRVCGIAPAITLVSGPQSRDNFEQVHALNALGRGVEVDQIVAALDFLLATPTITGQTITLDAGKRFLGLSRDVQFLDTP
ncbi:SDR family NAD(P)-dependent oxidoreductase [Sphingomonas sp. 1P06PA]|uniref:SDR family NAD(P)-dependent oxidoreductase n=1 Tax=Sphingomonas sp. 1P06PA TaxID=554121 RepID=UPI0039A596F6